MIEPSDRTVAALEATEALQRSAAEAGAGDVEAAQEKIRAAIEAAADESAARPAQGAASAEDRVLRSAELADRVVGADDAALSLEQLRSKLLLLEASRIALEHPTYRSAGVAAAGAPASVPCCDGEEGVRPGARSADRSGEIIRPGAGGDEQRFDFFSSPLYQDRSFVESRLRLLSDPSAMAVKYAVPDAGRSVDRFRVVGLGAKAVPAGMFEDCVAIGNARTWCCTGVVIGPNVVLTAGHCVGGADDPCYVAPIDVYVGSNVRDEASNDPRVRPIKVMVRHQNYFSNPRVDLAIIITEQDIPNAVPRRMASTSEFQAASQMRVAGFGKNNSGESHLGPKLMADVALSRTLCTFGNGCYSSFELVGESNPIDRNDTCNGDSGGPAYISVGGEWKVAGITSRALYPNSQCGTGGIYTRVDALQNWIRFNAVQNGGRLADARARGAAGPAVPRSALPATPSGAASGGGKGGSSPTVRPASTPSETSTPPVLPGKEPPPEKRK